MIEKFSDIDIDTVFHTLGATYIKVSSCSAFCLKRMCVERMHDDSNVVLCDDGYEKIEFEYIGHNKCLGSISIGKFFRHDGEVYLKINHSYPDSNMCLDSNGKVYSFVDDSMVEKVKRRKVKIL